MPVPFLGSTSGLTPQRLRARRYVRLSRDLYVLGPGGVDLRTRAAAVRLLLPDAVVCGPTAAVLQRLPVDDDGLVHVVRARDAGRSRRQDVRVHRVPVDADEVLDLAGLPVTDGPRTWVDLAAHLSLEDLAAVGDVVLRRYGSAALAAAVARRPGRTGLPLARRVLPLLDAGSASPAETRLRLRLHAAGFTALRHGVVVRDAGGGWLAAPDLADEQARVAVQYDGDVHRTRARWQHDVDRDELTRAAGWQVVVATARDDRDPRHVVDRVAAAYRRAGWSPVGTSRGAL